MKTFKRISLLVLAVIICVASADAKILRFGVKAGANFNKLSFSKEIVNDINKANSAGWEAGLLVEANVPIIGLGFDLSLMYARMNNNGSIMTKDGYELNYNSKNFLMLPINVRYKISLPLVGRYFAPYVFTGPNFLFNLNKNTIADLKNKKCQAAWNLGLGIELFQHLQIAGSYNFGIGSIGSGILDKVAGTTTSGTNYTIKNNYWMVTAAYLF